MLEQLLLEVDTDFDCPTKSNPLGMEYKERLREMVPNYQQWLLSGAEMTPELWNGMKTIAKRSGTQFMEELLEQWEQNTYKTSLTLHQARAVIGSALIKMRRELVLSGDVSGFLMQIDDLELRLAGLLYCVLSKACSNAVSAPEYRPRQANPN